MDHGWFKEQREKLRRWRGIRRALVSSLRVEPSEAFVQRVMSGVEAPAAVRPAPADARPARGRPWVFRLPVPQWAYPELGLAAALLLVLLLGSLQRVPVSTEALLLGRLPARDRWVGSTEGG